MYHDNPLDVFKENLLEQTQKIHLTETELEEYVHAETELFMRKFSLLYFEHLH